MALASTYSNTTVKSEFIANSNQLGDQLRPDVVSLSNGGFAVAYNNQDVNDGFILVDFFDARSNRIGDFKIPYEGETKAIHQPSITQLANGNVLVVWDDDEAGNGALRGRLFTSGGTALGDEIDLRQPLPTATDNYQDPQVTALKDFGFAVTYTFTGNVYIHFYDNDGLFIHEELINTTAFDGVQNDTTITVLADGGFVVTYTNQETGDSQIRARIFNADASLRTGDFLVAGGVFGAGGDNTQSKVVGLPGGNWAVAYTDSGWNEGGALGNGISLQIFTPSGAPAKPGTVVHVNAASGVDEREPDITVLDNGFIMVTWTRPLGSGSSDVYGRVFDQGGKPVTAQFAVTTGVDADGLSSVSGLASGQYVAAWQNGGADIDGSAITAEINEIVRTTLGDGDDDVFAGDALRDIVDGGGGNDSLSGGGGNDSLSGGGGQDKLIGNAGNDTIEGGGGNDVQAGGTGNDRLLGATGFDKLNGGAGGDILLGGEGNDTVTGGIGRDVMAGSSGNDSFRFAAVGQSGTAANTRDIITDFAHLVDKIDLLAIDAIVGGADNAFAFIGTAAFSAAGQIRAQQAGTDTILAINAAGAGGPEMTIQLSNFTASTLSAVDFIL